MRPNISSVFAVLLAHLIGPSLAEYLLHTFAGKVGAGNYTYYKLSKEGNVNLVLESIQGDADIYVSDQTLTPDFENYDMKSATCGIDEVFISYETQRPIGVGVYGYIGTEVSYYRLHVYVDSGGHGGHGSGYGAYSSSTGQHKPGLNTPKDEEESLLWTIFISILKILFDVLV